MKSKTKTLAFTIAIGVSLSANTASAAPYCREYTETFQIGGHTQQGYGTACLQPDGSWQKQEASNVSYDESYEQQKQNVVYVIDRQPVQFIRPYRPYYQSYAYAEPYNFFSLSFGNVRYRNNYHNHDWNRDRGRVRGHGGGHGGGYHR